MKYIIMTEGTCEKALIDVLICKGLFKIPIESLLYEQIFHARQIKSNLLERINQLPPQEKLHIIRIGDSLTDELIIPDDLEDRVEKCEKICIKPEFEMLYLIHKNEDINYIKKYKSKNKPSEYLKKIYCEYEKSYEYNYDYFDSLSKKEIKEIIHKYSCTRKLTHNKDEGLLESLIK